MQNKLLANFAHHIEGLTAPSLTALSEVDMGNSVNKAKRLVKFQRRINGNEMLDSVAAFWDGLYEQRRKLAAIH